MLDHSSQRLRNAEALNLRRQYRAGPALSGELRASSSPVLAGPGRAEAELDLDWGWGEGSTSDSVTRIRLVVEDAAWRVDDYREGTGWRSAQVCCHLPGVRGGPRGAVVAVHWDDAGPQNPEGIVGLRFKAGLLSPSDFTMFGTAGSIERTCGPRESVDVALSVARHHRELPVSVGDRLRGRSALTIDVTRPSNHPAEGWCTGGPAHPARRDGGYSHLP